MTFYNKKPVLPLSILRLCIALFTVTEGWLLLDIGWFVLFLYTWFYYLMKLYVTIDLYFIYTS